MVKKIEGADVAPVAPASAETALAELERQAHDNTASEARAGQAQAQKEEAAKADALEVELQAALGMAYSMAQPQCWWMTESQFEKLWGPKVRKGIAENGAVIMRRLGWTMGDLFDKWGPYLGILGVVLPSAVATVQSYRIAQSASRAQPASGQGATS